MKMQFIVLGALVFFAGCSGTADSKVPELANEMCDCFTGFDKSLSADAKNLMKDVADSKDPQKDLLAGMSKLAPEEAAEMGEKMRDMGTKGTTINTCMEEFDKKHSKETTKDKGALTKNMLKEMKAKGNCPTGAAMMNLAVASGKLD